MSDWFLKLSLKDEMQVFKGHKKAILSVTSSYDMERIISGIF